MEQRKLRMGMVGGGSDGFIGAIHRHAALMDNQIELVCGCFSVVPEISYSSGKSYYLPNHRIYRNYDEMFEKESRLPFGERMDFVTIVTPNKWHFDPAIKALNTGFDVVIDKPITFSLKEAELLKLKLEESGLLLAITHVYSGYPAIKEAKERIQRGDLGKVRKIFVEYLQGWLSSRVELNEGSNAGWRTDPKRSGKAGSMGDIGTHSWHLAEYVSGLKVESMCADLSAFVPGRPIDDDGVAILRFEGGAKGVLMVSQIAAGEENGLKLRIYGEKGGLEWNQQEPNTLWLKWVERPTEIIRTGNAYMGEMAQSNTRTPGGHPEGFIEAFANIYKKFSFALRARLEGKPIKIEDLDFPGIMDGLRGMQFIETSVKASEEKSEKWVDWCN